MMTIERETQETLEEKAKSLKIDAVMFDAPVKVKEILQDFVLITYDIPRNSEGDRARAEFYHQARSLGAVQHTESVYYSPWTPDIDILAIQLSKVKQGKVYVWYAKTDEETAQALTRHYDLTVHNWFDDLDQRLEKISGHVQAKKFKIAYRMLERTGIMLLELGAVVERRGSAALAEAFAQLKGRVTDVANELAMAL